MIDFVALFAAGTKVTRGAAGCEEMLGQRVSWMHNVGHDFETGP